MGRENKKVCFIGGVGHSGSTLLGLILGSHPRCFYAGEAGKTRRLVEGRGDPRKRTCKLCGPSCRIWSGFELRPDIDLYEQISRRVERPVIIDSSKKLRWIRRQMAALETAGVVPRYIFLQRDGRAVINSRVRKYPDEPPRAHVDAWVEQIRQAIEFYENLSHPKLAVRYERLASEPEATTRRICEFLEIEFIPSMLEFYVHEHHPLGGNNGTQFMVARHQGTNDERPYTGLAARGRDYYQGHSPGIRLDLRWKHELEPGIAALFEQVAGDLNTPYRWEG